VHPHPDPQFDALRPGVSCECTLGRASSFCSRGGLLEDDEEFVTAVVDDVSAGGRDRVAEQTAMVVEELGVAVAEPLDELRRALDVGEDERDGSMRKFRRSSLF